MAKDSYNWPECVHSSLACIVDGLGGCCGQRQEEKIEFGTTVSVSLSLSFIDSSWFNGCYAAADDNKHVTGNIMSCNKSTGICK